MNDKKMWLSAWGAISVLWILYWIGMSLALGTEALQEMIAGLAPPLLIGGLIVSVPATLYLAGTLVGCLASGGRGKAR